MSDPHPPRESRTRTGLLWFSIALAGSAWLLAPTLRLGFGWDQGFNQYKAWAWLQGLWPYVGTWDTVYPGGILYHLIPQWLGGTTPFALRMFDLVIQLGVAACMVLLASRVASPRAGAIAALLYFSVFAASGFFHTAQPDGVVVFYLLAGLLLFWFYQERPSRWKAFAAGLALGLACFSRPTNGLIVAAAALAVLFVGPRDSWRTRLADATTLGLGALLPLGVFAVVYAARGQFGALADHFLYLEGFYARQGRFGSAAILSRFYDYLPPQLLLGGALSLLGWSARQHRGRYASLLGLAALCVAVRLIEGKAHIYQLWPSVAAIALVAGIGWDNMIDAMTRAAESRSASRRMLPVLAAVVLAAIFIGQVRPFLEPLRQDSTPSDLDAQLLLSSPALVPVARYLRDQTAPQARLLSWGTAPGLYYAAQRLGAGRFVDFHPLLCDFPNYVGRLAGDCENHPMAWLQERFVAEYLADVRRADYFVAHERDGSLAVVTAILTVPDFPALREVLQAEFEPEARFEGWTVFRRKYPE